MLANEATGPWSFSIYFIIDRANSHKFNKTPISNDYSIFEETARRPPCKTVRGSLK